MKFKTVPVRVFCAGYEFVTLSLVEYTFNPRFLKQRKMLFCDLF